MHVIEKDSHTLHRIRRIRALLLMVPLLVTGLTAADAEAQSRTDTNRPRVGLVLSGGSAKGFAHLGVIEALEQLGVPVDIVTGVSMGGLVGGLYAMGYTSQQIEQIAKQQDWTALFTDAPERGLLTPDRRVLNARTVLEVPLQGGRLGLPGGVVRGQNILRLLQRLTWPSQMVHDFTGLPRPFAAVATNLETGAAVVLDSGLIAEAMRATVALPGGIEPYRLDSQVLVDGGLARNLPAQDARALGADVLICSDVTENPSRGDELRSILDILLQVVALGLEASTEPQRRMCDVLIRPDVKKLSPLDFQAIDEWIDRGRTATLEHSAALRRYTNPHALDPERFRSYLPDSIRITDVQVTGVREDAHQIATRAIDLPERGFVSARILDDALARLYATDLFSQAIYRLEPRDGDTIVVFQVRQEARDQVGFGFRYDDHRKASLLFTGTIHNLLRYGSTLLLEWRLGDESVLGARFLPRLGTLSPISTGADARHTRALFDIYDGGQRIAEIRSRVTELSVLGGASLGRSTVLGLRPGLEYTDAQTTVSQADTSQQQLHAGVTIGGWSNSLNREAYPLQGTMLTIQSTLAARLGSDDDGYTQTYVSIEHVVPIASHTTARGRIILGAATGDNLPFHRFFYMGGAYPSSIFAESRAPFWGLRPEERMGKSLQVFRLSVQQRLGRRFYLTAGGNVGNVFPDWSFEPANYSAGWGIALGTTSAVGPIEITAHGRGLSTRPLLDLNIGFPF